MDLFVDVNSERTPGAALGVGIPYVANHAFMSLTRGAGIDPGGGAWPTFLQYSNTENVGAVVPGHTVS